jgi:hypothetical protein
MDENRLDSGTASESGWPPVCTLAELGRILTLVHGVRAPTESSLKKWSAAGAFSACIASAEDIAAAEAGALSLPHAMLQRPRRAGRPGLKLRTSLAIARVYELWPFLADSDPQAVVELVAARTADHLRRAVTQAVTPAAATMLTPAATDEKLKAAATAAIAPALQDIERQLSLLTQEMAALKREVAQFSALRNNLVTRLDDAVSRAKDALQVGATGGGIDPLVEARRDRDMGVMKSTLAEILTALQRLEAGRGGDA